MKGTDSNPGALLVKAVENYKIDTVVIGRRGLGGIERLFVGSTSRYVVENAECNVIVVKNPFGPPEERGASTTKAKVVQAEEHERIRRIEEEGPAEIHDTTIEDIKNAEEIERARRIEEQAHLGKQLKNLIVHYKFHEEINKMKKVDN